MAKVHNAIEKLPKIWTAWVRRTNVTDDRQIRLGRKVNLAPGKVLSGQEPSKCIRPLYDVAVQETAKQCAKFGWPVWPPVSDVGW